MFRYSRGLVCGAVVAVVVMAGPVVSAQRFGAGRRPGQPQAGLALGALELTEAQRQQVRQLTAQQREQNRTLVEQLRTAREARQQALEAIPFNEQQIRSAAQQLAELETDLAVRRARLQADVFALLTPDQQTRLLQLRAAREARLKARRDRLQQRTGRRRQPQA